MAGNSHVSVTALFPCNSADFDLHADVSDLVQGNMSAAAKDAMRMCGSTLIDSPCLVKCCSKFTNVFLISSKASAIAVRMPWLVSKTALPWLSRPRLV